jgi:hypothetical protein
MLGPTSQALTVRRNTSSPRPIYLLARASGRRARTEVIMKIEWIENKRFKPKIVLDRIMKARIIDSDGAVSFKTFEVQEALPALSTMLVFPNEIGFSEKNEIIWKALVGIKNEINQTTLKEKMIEIAKNLLKTRRKSDFFFLSSLSICNSRKRNIVFDNVEINVYKESFPEIYVEAREIQIKNHGFIKEDEKNGYTKVVVHVSDRDVYNASTKAAFYLDLYRGILCLLLNPRFEMFGREWKPINKIRLGKYHTIHDSKGNNPTISIWFEPNYMRCSLVEVERIKSVDKIVKRIYSTLEKSNYKNVLMDGIVRYVRALDETDQQTSLIKLWSSLENLSCIDKEQYDVLIKRVSFLFEDKEYHKQILEHLREQRNNSVHSGINTDELKNDCYQLQFYISKIIFFHLRQSGFLKNMEEAIMFLDSTNDILILKRKREVISKTIKYLSK